jgi:hypothetical protein
MRKILILLLILASFASARTAYVVVLMSGGRAIHTYEGVYTDDPSTFFVPYSNAIAFRDSNGRLVIWKGDAVIEELIEKE